MYEEIGEFVKITCDKCERSEIAESEMAGKSFFLSGWALKNNAKKYKHLCFKCQSKKQKDAHVFIKNKFRI